MLPYASLLNGVPEFASFGPLFTSSKPTSLTEVETEYVVNCIKHIFPEHIVFQFEVSNTMDDQRLENVYVKMELSADDAQSGVALVARVPIPVLLPNAPPSNAFVAFSRPPGLYPQVTFSASLKFHLRECDSSGEPTDSGGYDDTYSLEDVALGTCDYMQRKAAPQFKAAWDAMDPVNGVTETFTLASLKTIHAAVTALIDFLGMEPCEKSAQIDDLTKTTHVLLLSGTFLGGIDVLVRARLALEGNKGSAGCSMELAVRSQSLEISKEIAGAIA
jgi:coatomer protein complex subunit gamma